MTERQQTKAVRLTIAGAMVAGGALAMAAQAAADPVPYPTPVPADPGAPPAPGQPVLSEDTPMAAPAPPPAGPPTVPEIANPVYGSGKYGSGPLSTLRDLWHQAMDRGSVNAPVNLADDLTLDKASSAEDRQQAIRWLLDAARQGSAQAQARLRHMGYAEDYPRSIDGALPMHLEPRAPRPGHSSACKDFLVS